MSWGLQRGYARVILGAGLSGCLVAACASAGEGPATPVYSVARVIAEGDRLLGRKVVVEGRLENAGANYFTDRRIVLRDDNGRTLPVQPWVALEALPDAGGAAPMTLASYLGRRVRLEAVIEAIPMQRQGLVRGLRVTAAQLLPPEAGDRN